MHIEPLYNIYNIYNEKTTKIMKLSREEKQKIKKYLLEIGIPLTLTVVIAVLGVKIMNQKRALNNEIDTNRRQAIQISTLREIINNIYKSKK